MKKLYWRPRGISRSVLVLIAIISLLGLAAVELLGTRKKQPYFVEKFQAAQIALEGMEMIKADRQARGASFDPDLDPAQSGLIGEAMSSITTVTGKLAAKQTSINPNFAAVILDMLTQAGVKSGDTVAIGFSGSFPALNICVHAAVRAIEVKPIIISSISASQFGANDPYFPWIDMERVLNEHNKDAFPYRTIAASLGGVDDRALGMSKEGRQMLITATERNQIPLIRPKDFKDSIDQHMATYAQRARTKPIKAYINVGGGTISVGTAVGKRMFESGLNLRKQPGVQYVDSVMARFIEQGVPVIHLSRIEQMALRYGLPLQPTSIPTPGSGSVFYRKEYNFWLAVSMLLTILVSLYAFVRTGAGSRLFQINARSKSDMVHEPMV